MLSINLFGYSQTTIDEKFKKESVDSICKIINDYYVFPDIAKESSDYLQSQLKSGAFKNIDTKEDFAAVLTKELQSINNDKHMRVRTMPPRESQENTTERIIENQLTNLHRNRASIGGFSSVQRLDGNVGYIDYRGFYGISSAKEIIDSYMRLLEGSDAIVIDLRKNGGGDPKTVQYLCSYFFEGEVHLNSLYYRETEETIEYWTLDEVDGKKQEDIPLFVITSPYTFSGAEEFTYNMKTQKRASIVGENTGGGANPGGTFLVNEKLLIFVPTGTAINPITKTNWEGTGIAPDVKTNAEDAYTTAIELAMIAAQEYRDEIDERISLMYTELVSSLEDASLQSDPELSNTIENEIISFCRNCVTEEILGENDINMLGYSYLMKNQSKAAIALFKANIDIFPNSPNTYDSYAESLASLGEKDESIKYYEMAIQKAEEIGDPGIELYKENLERLKKEVTTE